MEKIRESFLLNTLFSFIFLAFGIFLLAREKLAFNVITYVIAIILVIFSAASIYKFTMLSKSENKARYFNLAIAIVFLALTVYFLIAKNAILSIAPVFFGIIMIINNCYKISFIKELKDYDNKMWKLAVFILFIMFLSGIFSILSFLIKNITLAYKLSLFLLNYGILNICLTYLYKLNYSGREIVVYE